MFLIFIESIFLPNTESIILAREIKANYECTGKIDLYQWPNILHGFKKITAFVNK